MAGVWVEGGVGWLLALGIGFLDLGNEFRWNWENSVQKEEFEWFS